MRRCRQAVRGRLPLRVGSQVVHRPDAQTGKDLVVHLIEDQRVGAEDAPPPGVGAAQGPVTAEIPEIPGAPESEVALAGDHRTTGASRTYRDIDSPGRNVVDL